MAEIGIPADHSSDAGDPTPRQAAPDRAERLVVAIACAAIVMAPVMIGASGPWARLSLEGAMAAAACLWAIARRRSPLPMLAILAVCVVAAVQIVPLPERWLAAVAPGPSRAWAAVQADLPGAWGTVSVDPAATATGIRRMFLWLATVLAIRDAAADGRARRWLGASLALSAALVWGLAIAFPVDRTDPKLLGLFPIMGPTLEYWKNGDRLPVQSDGGGFLGWAPVGADRYRYDEVMAGDGFGPFWSSNQFACTLLITLPFLLAGIVSLARRRSMPRLGAVASGLLVAAATATLWRVAGSRAGTASLGMGMLVFLQAMATGRWMRRVAAALAVAYGASILIFMAGYTGMVPELSRLVPVPLRGRAAEILANDRAVGMWAAGRMFLASPFLGSGLGSYATLYPDVRPGDYTFYYAYDEYAQLLAEAGLVGVAVALALAWRVAGSAWRVRGGHGSGRPLEAATFAALAGVVTDMFVEWSLHQPASGYLSAIVAGLVLAEGTRGRAVPGPPGTRSRPGSKRVAAAFVGVCLVALILLARDAWSDTVVATFRRALGPARPVAWRGPRPDPRPGLDAAVALGRHAARYDPGNPRLALVHGQACRHLAEWESGEARASLLAEAAECFGRSRERRATTLGLPEPRPLEGNR